MDRRVVRTRQQLREALTELLKTKSVQDITVCELADKVDISRGTFYLHYKNVFDMLEKIEQESLDNLTNRICCKRAFIRGAFLAVGLVPENDAFAEFANLNDWGYFDSSEDCLTITPGVFVAGDCRSKRIRQVVTASSDGAIAATAACAYLDEIG